MPRVDYSREHYCCTCEMKYPLDVFYCVAENGCGMRLRIVPRKQKRIYIQRDREPHYTPTQIRMMVQCKTSNPVQEKIY
jgi:hypothetical protein